MTGTTMGSLSYMSPEQVKERTYRCALGISIPSGFSLYEMVTGQRPFCRHQRLFDHGGACEGGAEAARGASSRPAF